LEEVFLKVGHLDDPAIKKKKLKGKKGKEADFDDSDNETDEKKQFNLRNNLD